MARPPDALCDVHPRLGYTAPNGRQMAERNFVELDDGTFRRHRSRQLFENAFADDGDADVLRMYRHVRCPTLIIHCTRSGAPDVLDLELRDLASANGAVTVLHLPLTHLAPHGTPWNRSPARSSGSSRPHPDDTHP